MWQAPFLVLWLAASCREGTGAIAVPASEPAVCSQESAMLTKAPEMPDGVLLQSLTVNARGQSAGYRIWSDGRYESQPRGQAWQAGVALTADQLARVLTAIGGAGLEGIATSHRPPTRPEDGNVTWMQVRDSTGIHHIEIVDPCRVPEIDSLSGMIVDVFRK